MGNNNNNRVEFPFKGDEEKQQEEMMKRLSAMAVQLYNMLPPGMTVELSIPVGKIITPGQPPHEGRLIITKPEFMMDIRGK